MTDNVEIQPPITGKERSNANLRMWKPGQSGNPKGRAKRQDAVKDLLDQHGPDAIQKLVALMSSDDERIALMAAKEIADRAYGKPKPAEDDDENKRSLTINILKLADGNNAPASVAAEVVSVRTLALS